MRGHTDVVLSSSWLKGGDGADGGGFPSAAGDSLDLTVGCGEGTLDFFTFTPALALLLSFSDRQTQTD